MRIDMFMQSAIQNHGNDFISGNHEIKGVVKDVSENGDNQSIQVIRPTLLVIGDIIHEKLVGIPFLLHDIVPDSCAGSDYLKISRSTQATVYRQVDQSLDAAGCFRSDIEPIFSDIPMVFEWGATPLVCCSDRYKLQQADIIHIATSGTDFRVTSIHFSAPPGLVMASMLKQEITTRYR